MQPRLPVLRMFLGGNMSTLCSSRVLQANFDDWVLVATSRRRNHQESTACPLYSSSLSGITAAWFANTSNQGCVPCSLGSYKVLNKSFCYRPIEFGWITNDVPVWFEYVPLGQGLQVDRSPAVDSIECVRSYIIINVEILSFSPCCALLFGTHPTGESIIGVLAMFGVERHVHTMNAIYLVRSSQGRNSRTCCQVPSSVHLSTDTQLRQIPAVKESTI